MLYNNDYQGHFVVADKTGTNVFLDISNIFTITIQTDRIVKESGKLNTTTRVMERSRCRTLGAELYFDDARHRREHYFYLGWHPQRYPISDSGQIRGGHWKKKTVSLSPAIGLGDILAAGYRLRCIFSGKSDVLRINQISCPRNNSLCEIRLGRPRRAALYAPSPQEALFYRFADPG